MKQEKTQVVIVGGGPNGITAAHYMGLYGIDCIVLELADGVLPYPRAVGMDDEALRVLQGIGIAELAARDMICNVPLRYYNARGVCFCRGQAEHGKLWLADAQHLHATVAGNDVARAVGQVRQCRVAPGP
nr:hypothetical protein GCM10020185_84200 [Pseudomonas brassicacearum subsp. brassicacearum]